MKLSLTFVLLLAGLVVLGDLADAAGSCDTVRCFQGGYITCGNYRRHGHRQRLDGCACVCAPSDGKGCVLHLNDGSSYRCRKGKPT